MEKSSFICNSVLHIDFLRTSSDSVGPRVFGHPPMWEALQGVEYVQVRALLIVKVRLLISNASPINYTFYMSLEAEFF